MKTYGMVVVIAVTIAGVWGCSSASNSGGGSPDVPSLSIPDQMSLVTAQEDSSKASLSGQKAFSLLLGKLTSDVSTAYYTDPKDVFVFDRSMESLNMINEILCVMDQTRYGDFVNEGPYIALVDFDKCSKSQDRSSSEGDQSSTEVERLEVMVIDSTRESDASDQVVSVWAAEEARREGESASEIQAKLTISEGVSDANPFGDFRIDFIDVGQESKETIGEGYLETVNRTDGKLEYQLAFSGSDGDHSDSDSTHVITNAAGTEGQAYTAHSFSSEGRSGAETATVAFNENFYLTDDGSEKRCLDRNNFDDHVFRYGVYKEDGSRLDIENPGFGIKYGDEYGWAGYWGIWFHESVTLSGGEQVVRANNDGTETTYTTVIYPGRLARHTRVELTLADITGDYLNFFDEQTGQNIQVVWDGSQLLKKRVESFGENGSRSWEEIAGSPPLACPATEWIGFWRDGLGSINLICPDAGGLSNTTPITSDNEQVLTAADVEFSGGGEISLFCFNQCLKADVSNDQFNWQNGETPLLTDAMELSTPYSYTISPTDMTLKRGGVAVRVQEGAKALEGSPNQWGLRSGCMVTSTSGMKNPWECWSQSTYYTWEVGPNPWNRFSGLNDSNGVAVKFDPPIQLDYTHPATGDRYILDYSAFGELHGIPWEEDANTGRWYQLIVIADGAELVSGSTTYFARALDVEQSMQKVDVEKCGTLTLESLSVPDKTFVDPQIGDRPTVSADPKVIKGELTGS